MKAKKLRSYRKAGTGNVVFVYAVSGTPEQIAAFEKAQGTNLKKDENTGAPLWFTTRYAGETCDLTITSKGVVIADMSKFDAAASLSAQYGGNLGQELAKTAAASLIGGNNNTNAEEPAKQPADLGKM